MIILPPERWFIGRGVKIGRMQQRFRPNVVDIEERPDNNTMTNDYHWNGARCTTRKTIGLTRKGEGTSLNYSLIVVKIHV